MKILPKITLAALAIALTGAGTASANTPMTIAADFGSVMSVTDEENLLFEYSITQNWPLGGLTFGKLGSGNGVFHHVHARCAGGEVRAELVTDAVRWADSETASVTARVDLYEGTNCSNTDLDGQSPLKTFKIRKGQTEYLYFDVMNEKEDDRDRAEVYVVYKAY